MEAPRLIDRPAFRVAGRKTYITGPDNAQFGRFWDQCRAEDLFTRLQALTGFHPGAQTGASTLGVSCVDANPDKRDFDYLIGVEVPEGADVDGLEVHQVPAARWAVFTCRGRVPDSIVQAEIFAFSRWLPASGLVHAFAPEMEVYFEGENDDETICEFWLPVMQPAS